MQDAEAYFKLVRGALLRAERTIFILGWDISGRTDLSPGSQPDEAPTRLDDLLRFVIHRRPHLRCYILVWGHGALYSLERDPFSRWRLSWRMPGRVKFAFDTHHPLGASHHQKVVVVDDRLAFSGSIDLTGHRWDTAAHRIDEPGRLTPVGKAYGPYHEVQIMVEGPVAAALGELARDRWRAIGVRRMPSVSAGDESLWPDDLPADLTDVDVGISRTVPEWGAGRAVRECEALYFDSIATARRSIYMESQYFTSGSLAAALARRLQDPDGPEVIVVSPRECQGWLEKNTMGAFRNAVFRRLIAADAYRRLRIVQPVASRAGDVSTFVHSKVMIVDDTLLRIGSANCANRSMGMDTECDLSVEATGPQANAGVRRVRDRLVGEHLGMEGDEVGREIARLGTLRALIDARADRDRTLTRIDVPMDAEPAPRDVQAVVDPNEPMALAPVVKGSLLAAFARVLMSLLRFRAAAATHRHRAEFG